jgi:hypothetical protein
MEEINQYGNPGLQGWMYVFFLQSQTVRVQFHVHNARPMSTQRVHSPYLDLIPDVPPEIRLPGRRTRVIGNRELPSEFRMLDPTSIEHSR